MTQLRMLCLAVFAGVIVVCGGFLGQPARAEEKPNFVVIFCDDLGYGDLGCFGHPTIRTPNLDRMAVEGQRWTDFYVGASVCTPSRAALITGRLPVRTGMCSDRRRVLFPNSAGGLPQSEITLAEALKDLGYATACVGKWHLGHLPEFLPTNHGFDSYFGIPYSNDMDRVASSPRGREAFWNPEPEYFNVPLIRGTEVVERPANQYTITKRYSEEAVQRIRENQDRPFFIYLAHNLPHVPLFASEEFQGQSRRGLYGDVVEEIDAGVGLILDTLEELQLDRKTLVVFTSDNGPWSIFDLHGGSSGILRGAKGSTWEGGMREPTIFWWPGTISPDVVNDIGCTMDLLPTFVTLAGGEPPKDRTLDGYDISPVLLGTGASARKEVFYYRGTRLFAVRWGRYKAHFRTQSGYGQPQPEEHDPPLLFDLWEDPGEQYNIADEHADVLAEIDKLVEEHEANLTRPESQVEKIIGQ